MESANLSRPSRQALQLLADTFANFSTKDSTNVTQRCNEDLWFFYCMVCFALLFVHVIAFIAMVSRVTTSHEACKILINELRNASSHQLHCVLKSNYIDFVGIRTLDLEHKER
ncbi:hypothetical protein N431DRAFT_535722 [Stipitochalara longipes BDJ]|nr:hypothetical protein N431DRAFT_535722 [Stipitochalara longipes BDJ]